MQCHQMPSQHPPVQSRNVSDGRRRWGGFLRFSGLLASVIHLVGCASTGLPTARERTAISVGEKAVVLLRVESTIENQQPYEPFHFYWGVYLVDDSISFGLGDFKTGGVPKRMETLRFLSPESGRNGWTYFVLPHGIYYLAVYPPRRTDISTYEGRLHNAPRWRIDVPENARLVYAGTLHLTGESDPLLFGGRAMMSIRSDQITVGNDHELAGRLFAEHFPGVGEGQVVLMQRHEGGPIILRSPLPAPTK